MYNKSVILNIFFILTFITSCQTKNIISFSKYEDLGVEKKKNVDENLADAKRMVLKKENEIVLLFQYNCFFDEKITVNNIYTKDFPKSLDKIHYGQKTINYSKKLGIIKLKLSNVKSFFIPQKKGYDYITICYNKQSDILYIHYYDFPKMIVEE